MENHLNLVVFGPDTFAADVARELGIHSEQIYNWRRQYNRLSEKQVNSMKGADYSNDKSEELRKLRRQIVDL
jgi:transposase